MFSRLAFILALLAASQLAPNTASACMASAQSQIATIDRELPKATLTKAQLADVQRLRARALELIDGNKQYEASRAAQNALAIIGYKPPYPPTRC